jgi:ATP-dependent Zn protease
LNKSSKQIALWSVLALVFFLIFRIFSKQYRREPDIIFSEFMGAVERGEVQEVTIQGQNILGKYKNGGSFRTFAPNDPDLVKSLRDKDVKIAAKPEDESPWYMVLLLNWFPMLLLVGVWIFFMRQIQVGGGKAMFFGKSRAKLLTENQHHVTFSDVAGVDEAKDDLQEIIAFLKDPKNADPIHKVTIISRGMALGLTQQLPVDEKHTYPREYLLNNLVILFCGRVAEELVLEHITTGAGNDIKKATDLARRMVCEWGMSEKLGPMTFGKKEEEIFLGRDFTQKVDYSKNTAVEIDTEVRRIIQESYHRAKNLLTTNLRLLHKVAEKLLEKEVLDGSEIDAIVRAFHLSGEDPFTPPSAAAIA